MTNDVRLITPAGAAGVAVLEVVGGRAEAALVRLMRRPLPAPGQVTLARLLLDAPSAAGAETSADAETIDEALVIARPDGSGAELHVHGSPAIVDACLRALGVAPRSRTLEECARTAAAAAPTELGARVMLAQADGRLCAALEQIVDAGGDEQRALAADLDAATARFDALFTRTRIVLAGPVNAGKSTLFNALVGEDAAVVSETPGTTRDALGAHATIGGWPVVLVDTAGARDLDGREDDGASIERAGQALARDAARRADLVLMLAPATGGESHVGNESADVHDGSGGPATVRLRSQAAAVHGIDPSTWPLNHLSALEHPEHAREVVASAVETSFDRPSLVDVRASTETVPPVLFAGQLRDAVRDLATGRDAARAALALDALTGAL